MAATSTSEPPAAASGALAPVGGVAPSAGVASSAGVSSSAGFTSSAGVLRLPAGESADGAQTRPRWWGELLVVAWLAVLYDTVTNLAPAREAFALAHGRALLSFEQSLGIDPELTLNRWLSHHHTLGAIASYYYDNAHFVVTLGLLGWLWWRRADIYRPLRNALVAINALGLLVFWLCPVAPPRMLAGSGFSDVVATSHTFGSWHTGSLATDADQFAAMPSLHLAWAAWCGLVIWRLSSRPWARTLAILYPCSTTLAVLSTGNHYLLDVFAGLATCAVAVGLVRLASVWRRRPV